MATVEADTMSNRQIAELYDVSEATLERWTARKRKTGSVAAGAGAGGRPRTLAPYAATVRAEVQRQPDISLPELGERVQAQAGVLSSPSMMWRELKILNLPVKKSRFTTRTRKGRG